IPPATAPRADQQQALVDLRGRLRMDLALYDAEGDLIGGAGNMPPLESQHLKEKGWKHSHLGAVWILPLSDGRRLVVRPQHMAHVSGFRVFLVPISIVLAFAIGAYPIARKLTRRLAQLQAGVVQLGAGDLSIRVPLSGNDELAALARSFNASAERIEVLVKSH